MFNGTVKNNLKYLGTVTEPIRLLQFFVLLSKIACVLLCIVKDLSVDN